ncbi:MAG: hypothetical protein R2710_12305 [Acidimicrobiales bacterium]
MSDFSALSTAASALYAIRSASVSSATTSPTSIRPATPGSGWISARSVRVRPASSAARHCNMASTSSASLVAATRCSSTFRNSGGDAAKAIAESESLKSIEAQLGPLREGSFSDQLNQFFNSFDDLANEPDDPATRQVTLQRAEQVAGSIRSQADIFNTARADVIDRVNAIVGEVNRLVDSIADLNLQVKAGSIGGSDAELAAGSAQRAVGAARQVGRHHGHRRPEQRGQCQPRRAVARLRGRDPHRCRQRGRRRPDAAQHGAHHDHGAERSGTVRRQRVACRAPELGE